MKVKRTEDRFYMNLKKVNLSRKRLENTSLSSTELAIVLGGLLGDGSLKIHPGYKNARYSFRHSIKQTEYFHYKCKELESLATEGSVQEMKPDGWSPNIKLRFCTGARTALTEIHSVTHKKNSLVVQRKWLNHLTAHSLAIWWFDDGSIIGRGRRGVFCTDGFTEKECRVLTKYLLVVWGVTGTPLPIKGKEGGTRQYWRLFLATSQLKAFLGHILPYLPCAEMVYKCLIRYVDFRLQQRWISFMESRLPPHLREECKLHITRLLKEKGAIWEENDIVQPASAG